MFKSTKPFILILGVALAGASQAQTYPSKPVRVVIGFPAGSAADTTFQVMKPKFQSELGQNVVMEYRPGAGYVSAMQFVTSQPADGYTLMYTTSTIAVTSALPKAPYDIRKDLTQIGQMVALPLYIAVNSEKMANVKTIGELVAYLKANPGKVNVSSYGVGSLAHLAIESFAQRLGLQVTHVPFKGSSENARSLAAGTSEVGFDVSTVLFPQVDGGRVRILASATDQPWPSSPQYPGLRAITPDFNAVIWNGLAGPAGLPADVVRKVNAAINVAIKEPAFQEYARKTAQLVVSRTPEEITEVARKDVETWIDVIRKGKLNLGG